MQNAEYPGLLVEPCQQMRDGHHNDPEHVIVQLSVIQEKEKAANPHK